MSARQNLLKYFRIDAKKPVDLEELYDEFSIDKGQRKDFKKLLTDLIKEGLLYKNNAGLYGLPEKFNLMSGRIERSPKGFAFLLPDDPELEDVFIALSNMDGAMHNDKVFVRILPETTGKKSSGEVVEIIERANQTIVGNFERKDYFGFVVPDNKRIFNDIFIPAEKMKGAKNGQKVVVKINHWPEKNRSPEGEVIEILGFKKQPGVDIEAIIRQLDLPLKFPAGVLHETEKISMEITQQEKDKREDLTDLTMFTIDGADAKDLDDAVSIEKMSDNNLRLGVHIADVSHYVKEDSLLDKEARERGTSIYLVDRVIPMLPPRLSNGICSLNPDVERLTLSVFIEYQLDPLEVVDYNIVKSVIKSNYRLTYKKVRDIIEKRDERLLEKYNEIVPHLNMMNELRGLLREERFLEGSIDFDFPEVKVVLDDKGRPVELQKQEHSKAEQLIEEFMIAANNIIAEDAHWKGTPFIYRVHDEPDAESMIEFNEFIHNFGYFIKGVRNSVHPRVLQEVLEDIKGKPEERIISTVLLRSMKKAVYAPVNIGHFGLALDFYTHFTSPIRRYPDLMIHRIIKEGIENGYLPEKRKENLEERIPLIAEHSSLQERKAMEAERDSVDLKKIEYMEDKIGEQYEGIISGVTSFGFFVELENMVEGLVHVENLVDDYYHFNRSQQALIGERTKKIYRLGDEVEVEVTAVNLQERQLDFELID